MLDLSNNFRAAIAATGMSTPYNIIPDGQIHRFFNGKRNSKTGWYVFNGYAGETLKKIKADEQTDPAEKEQLIQEFMEAGEDKERQTRKKWYATQIKRLAICMADFIYMTHEREYGIHDVIETKSPQFFEVMTGINKDDFNELCDKGFLNKFALNRIVREFRDQEDHSLYPEQYILNNLTPRITNP